MRNQNISAAPDYTRAALVMGGVNLAWIFLALWAIYGLAAVMLLALVLNHLVTLIERRRAG
ncbi:MAG: hypothetical protein AB8B51_09435 [Sedimentitalea sp.]